jgi:hypothetical protein
MPHRSISCPPHSIILQRDGFLTRVSPGLPDSIIRELEASRHGYVCNGPTGYEGVIKTEAVHEIGQEAEIYVFSGMVPRLMERLSESGYDLELRELIAPGSLFSPTVNLQGEGAQNSDQCVTMGNEPRGQIEIESPACAVQAIANLCRYFRDRLMIVADCIPETYRLAHRLGRKLPEPVATITKGRASAQARVVVGTIGSLDLQMAKVVILPRAEQALGARVLDALKPLKRPLVYGLRVISEPRKPYEELLLEGILGPVLYQYGSVARRRLRVTVDLADWPRQQPFRGHFGLAWKRHAIWSNAKRNHAIAAIATAIETGADAVLWEYGIFGDQPIAPDSQGEPSDIAILVESPEHARILSRDLPHWSVITGNDAVASDALSTRRDASLPSSTESGSLNLSIVTSLAASRIPLSTFQTVIRADGIPWSMPWREFQRHGDAPSREVVRLIDLRDDFDDASRSATQARIESYRERGWRFVHRESHPVLSSESGQTHRVGSSPDHDGIASTGFHEGGTAIEAERHVDGKSIASTNVKENGIFREPHFEDSTRLESDVRACGTPEFAGLETALKGNRMSLSKRHVAGSTAPDPAAVPSEDGACTEPGQGAGALSEASDRARQSVLGPDDEDASHLKERVEIAPVPQVSSSRRDEVLVDRHGKEWVLHRYCRLLPEMSSEEYARLKESIAGAKGNRQPIVLNSDGEVLDGRHRLRACIELGLDPYTRGCTADERELDLVLDLNDCRRHLTVGQRAMMAARFSTLRRGRPGKKERIRRLSRGHLCARLDLKPTLVRQACAILRSGAPELIAMVDAAKLKIDPAAVLAARLPKAQQATLIDQGPMAIRRRVQELRRERIGRTQGLPDLKKAGSGPDANGPFNRNSADPMEPGTTRSGTRTERASSSASTTRAMNNDAPFSAEQGSAEEQSASCPAQISVQGNSDSNGTTASECRVVPPAGPLGESCTAPHPESTHRVVEDTTAGVSGFGSADIPAPHEDLRIEEFPLHAQLIDPDRFALEARLWYAIRPHVQFIEKQLESASTIRSRCDVHNAEDGSLLELVRSLVAIPDPGDWMACPRCAGREMAQEESTCCRCHERGYVYGKDLAPE